jgi:hypothetical protein
LEGPTHGQLRFDPEWDSLRGDPAFLENRCPARAQERFALTIHEAQNFFAKLRTPQQEQQFDPSCFPVRTFFLASCFPDYFSFVTDR